MKLSLKRILPWLIILPAIFLTVFIIFILSIGYRPNIYYRLQERSRGETPSAKVEQFLRFIVQKDPSRASDLFAQSEFNDGIPKNPISENQILEEMGSFGVETFKINEITLWREPCCMADWAEVADDKYAGLALIKTTVSNKDNKTKEYYFYVKNVELEWLMATNEQVKPRKWQIVEVYSEKPSMPQLFKS